MMWKEMGNVVNVVVECVRSEEWWSCKESEVNVLDCRGVLRLYSMTAQASLRQLFQFAVCTNPKHFARPSQR